uniref:Reverse transcriptase zinc-binding domain-containing protein n=1 Tax=Arundo donax TaxID=35708 RepID=A0A0A9ESI1_ARUDO
MKLFNQALLARQAWCLIHFPNSLRARLLKAKYFPNGELIDTVFRGDASSTWRGVEHRLELLEKGLIWCIGSGQKVQIWRERWIPRAPPLKISLCKGRCRLRWVSQLMKEGRKEWDVDRFKECLFKHDWEEVLKVQLSDRLDDDLAWHYEKTRMFSVQSAYKLALGEQSVGTLQSSNSHGDGSRQIWDKIWSAQVPQKVRIFAWRLALNGLATQNNRHRQTLAPSAVCQICGREDEDARHAVTRCTKAVALRQAMRES